MSSYNDYNPEEDSSKQMQNAISKGINNLEDAAAIKDNLKNGTDKKRQSNKSSNQDKGDSKNTESPNSDMKNNINTDNLNNNAKTPKNTNKNNTQSNTSNENNNNTAQNTSKSNSTFKNGDKSNSESKSSQGNGSSSNKIRDSINNHHAKNENNNKGKNNNKNNTAKKASEIIKENVKKKKKQIINRRKRRLKVRIITWMISTLTSLFITIILFIVANPAILGVLLAVELADKLGITGVLAEAFSSYQQSIELQVETQMAMDEMWLNMFSSVLNSNDDVTVDDNSEANSNGTDSGHSYGSGFNPNDEYKNSLLKSYDLTQDMAKQAWKNAKKEAKKIGKEYDDYDVYMYVQGEVIEVTNFTKFTSFYVTDDTKPDDTSIDGINWGTFIAVIDLLYTAETTEPGTNSEGQIENIMYDTEKMEEYLIQDERVNHLYHIESSVEIKDKGNGKEEQYAKVIIYPFDYTDLFSMSTKYDENGNSIADSVITADSMFDANTTYLDMAKFRLQQMKDLLATEEVYNTLGLGNETPIKIGIDTTKLSEISTGNITVTNIEGNTVAEKLWNTLKEQGFTDIGAAAVLGNIEAESGFSTELRGHGTSIGLGQWLVSGDGTGRGDKLLTMAEKNGVSATDADIQISYLVNIDMPSRLAGKYGPTGNSKYEELKNATDLKFATDLVCAYYETPECWYGYDRLLKKHKYALYRYAQATVYFSAYGYSGNEWYFLDLEKRRTCATNRYNEFHEN